MTASTNVRPAVLLRVVSILLEVALAGNASTVASANENAAASGFKPVESLLDRKCTACHNSDEKAANLFLTPGDSYDALVGKPSSELPSLALVEPYKPEASYLLAKLTNRHLAAGGSGVQMPPDSPLTSADIDTITQWIASGAAP